MQSLNEKQSNGLENKDVDLVGDFRETQFNGYTDFSGTQFNGDANFCRVQFGKETYMLESSCVNHLNLTRSKYDHFYLPWKAIAHLDFDEASYISLINNYKVLGWYEDANDCYFDYRMEILKQFISRHGSASFQLEELLMFIAGSLQLIFSGFGVKPIIPLFWSATSVIIFGAIFRSYAKKNYFKKFAKEEEMPPDDRQNVKFEIKTLFNKSPIKFLDPFLFSLMIFTSGLTSFLQPTTEYKLVGKCSRYVLLERIIGSVLILFIITIVTRTYLIR